MAKKRKKLVFVKSHLERISTRTHLVLRLLINKKVVQEKEIAKIYNGKLNRVDEIYRYLKILGYDIKKVYFRHSHTRSGPRGMCGKLRKKGVLVIWYI